LYDIHRPNEILQLLLSAFEGCDALCPLGTVSNELTPWSRVLLEKLIFIHLVKKFPPFYGTGRCVFMFTSPVQSTPS